MPGTRQELQIHQLSKISILHPGRRLIFVVSETDEMLINRLILNLPSDIHVCENFGWKAVERTNNDMQ